MVKGKNIRHKQTEDPHFHTEIPIQLKYVKDRISDDDSVVEFSSCRIVVVPSSPKYRFQWILIIGLLASFIKPT
jgi:hypothetical protein